MSPGPTSRQSESDEPMLVRVAPEIVALLERGDVEPVVLLGAEKQPDGTYELILRNPDAH